MRISPHIKFVLFCIISELFISVKETGVVMDKSAGFYARFIAFAVMVFTAVSVQAKIPAELLGNDGVPSLASVIERVNPAVVNIAICTANSESNPLMADPFWRHFSRATARSDSQQQTCRSSGSGVIIDADNGYIVTNSHILDNADDIRVTLLNGKEFDAKRIGNDPVTNLAVIQIKAERLIQIALGNSDDLRVGDFALAIGNPFGRGQTITSGMISGLGRSGLGFEKQEKFIQTDVSINPGNSGGALVNLRGELIGINTIMMKFPKGESGIGFVASVNTVLDVHKELLRNYRIANRGMIGIVIQDLGEDLAREFAVEPNSGIVVSQVFMNSSAEKSGVEFGDIILQANDRKIASCLDLIDVIGELEIGDTVTLGIVRNDNFIKLQTVIEPPEPPVSDSGVTNESLRLKGAMIRNRFQEPGKLPKSRVVIDMIIPGSAAQQAGLLNGDFVLAVNRVKVSEVKEVRLMNITKNDRVLLLIQRDGHSFWIIVP